MTKITLFCLPYAGGSATVFNSWQPYLNESIELVPLELASRGRRVKEDLYQSLSDAVDDVLVTIRQQINYSASCGYAIIGHSMGGVISYELCHRIIDDQLPQPRHVFISGRGAPHVPEKDKKVYHQMSDDEFKEQVIKLGGTPAEFFDHPELIDFFMPMLKNDFRITETHQYSQIREPFNFNMSILVGKNEELSAEQIVGWMDYTAKVCSIHFFNGEHFFLNGQGPRICQFVNQALLAGF